MRRDQTGLRTDSALSSVPVRRGATQRGVQKYGEASSGLGKPEMNKKPVVSLTPSESRLAGAGSVTIVTPVYNEAESIPYFHKEISAVAKNSNYKFTVIYVDDGSTDDSVKIIESLKPKHCKIRLVELSRNFGKEIATTAGIEASDGDAVVIVDSDLQHPISAIPEFIKKWEEGYEVVVGVRKTHSHNNVVKKLGSGLFYKIMNRISETKLVPHSTDFRLMDRKVVDVFGTFTERQRITRGLIDWLGFRRGFVYFEAGKRLYGTPSYSTAKLMKLALNGITAHSLFPLRVAGYLGVIMTVFFGALGIFAYVERYILDDPLGLAISGTALLAILLLFTIGVILICLGLIALYIANIHGEVVNRPLYVTRRDDFVTGKSRKVKGKSSSKDKRERGLHGDN